MRRRNWQVIASLLIIQRVANKSAFSADTVAHESICTINAGDKGELTDDSGGYHTSSLGKYEKTSSEVGFGSVIDICREKA